MLIRGREGIALYNLPFAQSIVTCRRGVLGVFLPWGKGLKKQSSYFFSIKQLLHVNFLKIFVNDQNFIVDAMKF